VTPGADNLIFLSHIHEESAFAGFVKQALVDEFCGFVETSQVQEIKTFKTNELEMFILKSRLLCPESRLSNQA